MFKFHMQHAFLVTGFLFALTASLSAAAANPDSNLYTTYSFDSAYTNAFWTVCGSTKLTSGCYDFGTIGPFGKIGTLIEGLPAVDIKTGTVTRNIYVVDVAVKGGTAVKLDVYKKIDVVTASFDTTTMTFVKGVTLPLTGGIHAKAYMGADPGFLFIGTNESPFVVRVQKSNLAIIQIGGFSPPINVSSITTDHYGNMIVTFGGITGDDAFIAFTPTGATLGDGGGADFLLGTSNGLTTANLQP